MMVPINKPMKCLLANQKWRTSAYLHM